MTKKKITIILAIIITVILAYKIESSYGLRHFVTSLIYNQESVVGDIKKSNAYDIYPKFFSKVDYTENKNFIIPGLNTSMVPQGMCDTGNYILISAYDKLKDKNSCIYVINKSTGELIKSLYLYDSKSHVGGLAYDGNNVWVANGTEGTVSKILLTSIADAKDGAYIQSNKYEVKTVEGEKVVASFATYSNNTLWIGQYKKKNNTYAYGYDISNVNSLNLVLTDKYRIEIPNKIQGMAIDKSNRVILSQSGGRNNSSKIYVYGEPEYNVVEKVYYTKLSEPIKTIVAPPCSENIFMGNDDLLYILFESAADFYRNKRDDKEYAKTPVDRVCPITIE